MDKYWIICQFSIYINPLLIIINIFLLPSLMSFTSAPMPKMVCSVANPLIKIENPRPEYEVEKLQLSLQNNIQNEREPPKGNILHISNISPKLTYEQIKQGLYKLFSVHGPIYEILIKTKDNGQHFAFIDYPDIKDTEKAWLAAKNEGKILEGKTLFVNYCEDPKKNVDRKDQKCYICHGTGHKAIKCPVKPEMIKPKVKKCQTEYRDEEETSELPSPIKQKSRLSCQQDISQAPQEVSSQESDQKGEEKVSNKRGKRDSDYLRFLKLKKKYLQHKLKKKIKKMKKDKI